MSAWSIVETVRSRVELHRAGPHRPTTTPCPAIVQPAPAGLPSAPWLAICPTGARVLRDPSPARVRRDALDDRVVLVSDRMFGRRRLRRTARLGGLVIERELLVLPGTRRALVTVDEDATAVRHFWSAIAVVPPGLTWQSLPATVAVDIARRLPWSWTGSLLGGHVVIARRR